MTTLPIVLTIREKIIEAVAAGLATITRANSYQVTVEEVIRGSVVPQNTKAHPSVSLVDRGDLRKRHIKVATEAHLQLEVKGHTHEPGDDIRNPELSALLADIEKMVMVDETWGQLAVKTNVIQAGSSSSDLGSPIATDTILLDILYRVSRYDPYVLAVFN